MGYIALGVLALAGFLWIGGGRRVLKRREWRLLAAAFAIAAFAGGGYAAVRGEWPVAIVLLVLGLWMASTARVTPSAPAAPKSRMSPDEARRILGVGPDATRAEIQAAHKRLMRMAHPDAGGTAGLAAQLNAARDVLLRR